MNLNVNFNILKQFNCALVGRIKDLIRGYISVVAALKFTYILN